MASLDKLREIARTMGVGEYTRHVLLCLGPDCCAPEVGQKAWDVLKAELKSRGLSLGIGPNACYRTKANCLRICDGGPIMVVYPEGTWYCGMTAERIPRFIAEHLEHGNPVKEWIFTGNPLPHPSKTPLPVILPSDPDGATSAS